MKTFTASLLRIGFIDRQIRAGAYPTTVSIAEDLKKAYGETVDPRTIAADIASLRQDFKAPITYDFQHRGYYYTDPCFTLNVANAGEVVHLSSFLTGDSTKTAFIPEWQQKLLATVLENFVPVTHPSNPSSQRISIVSDFADSKESGRNEELVLQALKENKAIAITREADSFEVFFPFHVICYKKSNMLLVFGAVPLKTDIRYELFPLQNIQHTELLNEIFQPFEHITVQTKNRKDIEVIASTETKDILLIYTVQEDYTFKLLAKTEIFL